MYLKGIKPEWKELVIPAPAGYVQVSVDASAHKDVDMAKFSGESPFTPAKEYRVTRSGSESKETAQEAYMLAIFAAPETVKKLGDKNYIPMNVCTVQVLPENIRLKTLDEFKTQTRELDFVYEAGSGESEREQCYVPGALLSGSPEHYGMIGAGPIYAIWFSTVWKHYQEYADGHTDAIILAVLTSNLYLDGGIILLRMYIAIPNEGVHYKVKRYEIEEYKKLMVAWVTAITLRN